MFGVKGERGVASLGFSTLGVAGKNVLALPQGLSMVVGGRGAGMLSLSSVILYGVGLEAISGGLVESRILMREHQASVSADSIMSQAYNLSSFNPRASRIFLILNCSGLRLGQDVTFRLEDSSSEWFFNHTFNVREAGECQVLVLAVLERTDDGWRAGPVGALAERYTSFWAGRVLPQLCEHWTVGLPNPLSEEWRETTLTGDAFPHLVAHVTDRELPDAYQQGLADLGQDFTVAFATNLLGRLVYQWSGKALSLNRTAVFNDLLDRGADWCDILFGASLNDEQCIAALIRLGQMQASWAVFFLSTYSPSQIVKYACTEEKADAVYKLVPHGFLLDRLSEHRRVAVLERDLGL